MAIFGIRRWRGLKALVHDAIDSTTDLVDLGHESTMRAITRVTDEIEPLREPVRVIDDVRRLSTRGVLGTVRLVNRAIEVATDAALDVAEHADDVPLATGSVEALPMRSDAAGTRAWLGDAALGVVNAAVGDHLSARRNGLDLSMAFRLRDRYVSLDRPTLGDVVPEATSKVAIFVHGLGTTEWSWCLEAEAYHGDPALSFGALLERDLGFTPVFVRYNTGRHVSENGRRLAHELARFVDAYPVPIDDLTLIGHSMGGLVVRSACHYAEEAGLEWTTRVRRLFYIGAPHRGAPLAKISDTLSRALDRIDLPAPQIMARVVAARSAGIKDLRHGAVVDEDWLAAAPPDDAVLAEQLLPTARHYFLAATVTDDPEHAVGRLVGDLMVRAPSAAGPTTTASHLSIETNRHGGVLHHQLQNHPTVYAMILRACSAATPAGE